MRLRMEDYLMIQEQRRLAKEAYTGRELFGKELWIPVGDTAVRCLLYRPASCETLSPVYFDLHGGGFVFGAPEDDDLMCREFSDGLNLTVIGIDYPLAPEQRYPKEKETTYQVIQYIVEHAEEFHIDPFRMAVGGHSAGANIATVICMMAAKKKEFAFCCQILDYPPLDLKTDPKNKFFTDGAIPPEVADLFNRTYCEKEEAGEMYCSPLFAPNEVLSQLPPAIILTCEKDSLREEAEEYAKRLMQAGVEITARRFLGVSHGFTCDPNLPAAAWGRKMMMEGLKKYLTL